MAYKEIAFVANPVTDVPRARRFYEEVLGLTCTMHEESELGVWIEYAVGTGTLAISTMWEPSGQSGPSGALEVDDFDETIARIQSHGIEPNFPPMDIPTCRLAVFNDPDGNAVTIHQRKQS